MMVGWHVVEMRGRAGRWTPQGPVIGRLAQPVGGYLAICGLSDPAQRSGWDRLLANLRHWVHCPASYLAFTQRQGSDVRRRSHL